MTIAIAGTVDLGAREQTIDTVYLSGGAIGDGSLTSANGVISTGGSGTSLGGSTALTANGGVTALLSNTYTGATTINSGATITGTRRRRSARTARYGSMLAARPTSAATIDRRLAVRLGRGDEQRRRRGYPHHRRRQ